MKRSVPPSIKANPVLTSPTSPTRPTSPPPTTRPRYPIRHDPTPHRHLVGGGGPPSSTHPTPSLHTHTHVSIGIRFRADGQVVSAAFSCLRGCLSGPVHELSSSRSAGTRKQFMRGSRMCFHKGRKTKLRHQYKMWTLCGLLCMLLLRLVWFILNVKLVVPAPNGMYRLQGWQDVLLHTKVGHLSGQGDPVQTYNRVYHGCSCWVSQAWFFTSEVGACMVGGGRCGERGPLGLLGLWLQLIIDSTTAAWLGGAYQTVPQ